MSWWSADNGLVAYVKERFPFRTFVPVSLFLALPALGSGASLKNAATLTLVLMMVFQFRLLDDLADLEADRTNRPERVLSRAERLRPYHVLSGLLMVLVLVMFHGDAALTIGYLALLTISLLWYRAMRRGCSPILSYHVVLLKYPAFVLLASGFTSTPFDEELWLAVGLVYVTFLCYEALHDTSIRSALHMDAILRAELVVWAAAFLLVTGFARHIWLLAAIPVLVSLVWGWRRTSSGIALFLLSFFALLSFQFRGVP